MRTGSAGGNVLVIGDADRAEMRPLVAWLQDFVSTANRRIDARDISGIEGQLANQEFPDLIVVLQSWPNEFSKADVQQLLAFAPLARVVVCYGAWCESDGRNIQCWPLSVRVPVWAAKARIEREWQLIRAPGGNAANHVSQTCQQPGRAWLQPSREVGTRIDSAARVEPRPPVMPNLDRTVRGFAMDNPSVCSPGGVQPLPWSASREEVFAADHPPITSAVTPQRVLIDSPDSAYRHFLGELITEAGHSVVDDRPTVLLFDVDPWGPIRSAALHNLMARHPETIAIGLASLIQPPLSEELGHSGVHNLLPKLGDALNQALSNRFRSRLSD